MIDSQDPKPSMQSRNSESHFVNSDGVAFREANESKLCSIARGLLNPFPGLRPFEFKDFPYFAGRTKQIDELGTRLQKNNFLAVLGVSGSGKSSLIKAGLVPALYQGGFLGSKGTQWKIAGMRPGRNPLGHLFLALFKSGLVEHKKTENHMPKAGFRTLHDVADDMELDENLLLVVDQFEEIFRYTRHRDIHTKRIDSPTDVETADAEKFITVLLDAVRDQRIFIILTMRSDFLAHCARFPRLTEQINRGQYLIPALQIEEQQQIIEYPIYATGPRFADAAEHEVPGFKVNFPDFQFRISRQLIDRLLSDMGSEPARLPLLQHALRRMWDEWAKEGDPWANFDLCHYAKASGSGTSRAASKHGLEDSLDKHANEAWAGMDTEEHKKVTKLMFQRITEGTDKHKADYGDNFPLRRPTDRSDIEELLDVQNNKARKQVLDEVIGRFRNEKIAFLSNAQNSWAISGGQEQADENVPLGLRPTTDIIDISHESLCRYWQELRKWVEEEFEAAWWYERTSDYLPVRERLEAKAEGEILQGEPIGVRGIAPKGASKPSAVLPQFSEPLPNSELDIISKNYLPDSREEGSYWTEVWSRRYNESFPVVREFVEYSKEKRQERRGKRKARQRWIIFGWSVGLTILIVMMCLAGFALLGRQGIRVSWSEHTATEAETYSRQWGAFSQERSALFALASQHLRISTHNLDLERWDEYLRIRQPTYESEPIPQATGAKLTAFFQDPRDPTHSLVAAQRLENDTGNVLRHVSEFLSFDPSRPRTLEKSKSAPKFGDNNEFLTANGRLTAWQCMEDQSRVCVRDIFYPQSTILKSSHLAPRGAARFLENSRNANSVVIAYQDCGTSARPCHCDDPSAPAPCHLAIETSQVGHSQVDKAITKHGETYWFNSSQIKSRDAQAIQVSDDGRYVAVSVPNHSGNRSSDVILLPGHIGGTNNASVASCGGPIKDVTAVAFSPDSRFIAVGSNKLDQKKLYDVRVYDLSKKPCAPPRSFGHFSAITALAFGEDRKKRGGVYLASASLDGELRISYLYEGNGQEKAPLKQLWATRIPLQVRVIEFSPKGDFVALGNQDDTTRIFDLDSSLEIARLASDGIVNSLSFNADGGMLAFGSEDGSIKVFDLSKERRPKPSDPFDLAKGTRVYPREVRCPENQIPIAASDLFGVQKGYLVCIGGANSNPQLLQMGGDGKDSGTSGNGPESLAEVLAVDAKQLPACSLVQDKDSAVAVCNGIVLTSKREIPLPTTPVGAAAIHDGVLYVADWTQQSSPTPQTMHGEIQVSAPCPSPCKSTTAHYKIPWPAEAMTFGEKRFAYAYSDPSNQGFIAVYNQVPHQQSDLSKADFVLKVNGRAKISVLVFGRHDELLAVGTDLVSSIIQLNGAKGNNVYLQRYIKQGRVVTSMAFDDAGKRFATGDQAGVVRVIDIKDETDNPFSANGNEYALTGAKEEEEPFAIISTETGIGGVMGLHFNDEDTLAVVSAGTRHQFIPSGLYVSTAAAVGIYHLPKPHQAFDSEGICQQIPYYLDPKEINQALSSPIGHLIPQFIDRKLKRPFAGPDVTNPCDASKALSSGQLTLAIPTKDQSALLNGDSGNQTKASKRDAVKDK